MGNRTKEQLLQLIMIGLLTGNASCTGSGQPGTDYETDLATDTTETDSNTEDTDDSTDTEDSDSVDGCPDWNAPQTFTIGEIDGAEPTITSLCAPAAEPIIASSQALAVQFTISSEDLATATGHLKMAEGLSPYIVGAPTVTMDEAWPSKVQNASISDVRPGTDGFDFDVTFSEMENITDLLSTPFEGNAYMKLRFQFTINCSSAGGEADQQVQASSIFYLCGTVPGEYMWRGPTEECERCAPTISEIAAVPIPAGLNDEGLLSASIQTRIVPIGHRADNIFFLAQCNAIEVPSYHWRASDGTIHNKNTNLAFFEKPRLSGPHLVQVAVLDSSAAANVGIATYRVKQY